MLLIKDHYNYIIYNFCFQSNVYLFYNLIRWHQNKVWYKVLSHFSSDRALGQGIINDGKMLNTPAIEVYKYYMYRYIQFKILNNTSTSPTFSGRILRAAEAKCMVRKYIVLLLRRKVTYFLRIFFIFFVFHQETLALTIRFHRLYSVSFKACWVASNIVGNTPVSR